MIFRISNKERPNITRTSVSLVHARPVHPRLMCFPWCPARSSSKMADALDEFEKEAGCVPILHPEVEKNATFTFVHHNNDPKRRRKMLVNDFISRRSVSFAGQFSQWWRGAESPPLLRNSIDANASLSYSLNLSLFCVWSHEYVHFSRLIRVFVTYGALTNVNCW